MTVVPLPASPCVRVKLDYTQADGSLAGSRFYLSYAGAAPTAANCSTLATDIATAWNTDIAAIVNSLWSLTEVDVLDIATDAGASGTASVDHTGTYEGDPVTAAVATNVEFDIARRYRGGKPRMFFPPGGVGAQADAAHWTTDYINGVNAAVAAWFTAIEALDVGAVGALAHVNLSYYKGFTNVTNSSGRTRAAPTYRAAALLDTVTGYACKGLMGAQRRRRNAVTY